MSGDGVNNGVSEDVAGIVTSEQLLKNQSKKTHVNIYRKNNNIKGGGPL